MSPLYVKTARYCPCAETSLQCFGLSSAYSINNSNPVENQLRIFLIHPGSLRTTRNERVRDKKKIEAKDGIRARQLGQRRLGHGVSVARWQFWVIGSNAKRLASS